MGSWYGYKSPMLEDSYPCSSCGHMIVASGAEEHSRYCTGRVREAVQCPDCKAMLTKGSEDQHRCPVKIAREKAERKVARLQKAKERREAGLVTTVKMLSPKEEMTFMQVVSIYGDDTAHWDEVTVEKNPWKCRICGLVWQTKQEAENCSYKLKGSFVPVKPPHSPTYQRLYGVRYVENGIPKGPYMHTIDFQAMRKEEPEALPEGKKWDIVEAEAVPVGLNKGYPLSFVEEGN